ncbi:MAG TPA: hypothetical protein VF587_15030 [Solirubrobacteraceae bacterium]
MSAAGVVLLVVGLGAFFAVMIAVVMRASARRAGRTEEELRAELGDGVRRIETARGLGLRSAGRGQVRGTGTLVLTSDELRFRQWVPRRDTRIPLAAVTDVGSERWWLGKTVGRPLVRVTWLPEGGKEDAMAWQVQDAEAWLAELRPAA